MNRKRFITTIAASGAGALVGSSLLGKSDAAARLAPSGKWATDNWDQVRSLFPLRSEVTYLNTGGLGPASQPALDRVFEQSQTQARIGEHYHKLLAPARETAAAFFGVNSSEIAFVRNASEGNSVISSGLSLKKGDEVVFESHAHPGGSFAWMNRQKLDGVKVKIFEPSSASSEENLERLFDQVTDRTRVIQVSHITATTGLIFDIPAIAAEAKRRGIWFHVDGAQSAGMIPVNLKELGCDSYATSGHKWLNGPIETGMVYIAAERNDEVACSHIGAYSNDEYELPSTLTYVDSAVRHEYGTRNAASVVGLQTAFELQNQIGRQRIADHGASLSQLVLEELSEVKGLEILSPIDPAMRSSILTFRVPGVDCGTVYNGLSREHKFRTRVVTERGLNGVRASWHVYHQETDARRYADAVRSVVAGL
ncbi:aminotransferase class V-fold PLP-dependent enzyme [Pelagicoccus sp. SDUM812002]|uniref:aminotransferase class V-fold PLP-dependent enzyme n=1 Tax=Pelagicoccus sp. SDUM812002 TaxID=3041266 RepID=UPI00280DA5CA|nr:aminotransferase class V-fold PLP-dependent enzyme [Pelagicoccus sp. SDUM812002]MDQ8187687.1 aminotransferase class V-fold PLP-dependent enzyme [Pelagicoccus sp. SDUM812002]